MKKKDSVSDVMIDVPGNAEPKGEARPGPNQPKEKTVAKKDAGNP